MKVTHTSTFEAPLEAVYALLTDTAFREYSAAATGVISAEVTVAEADGGHVVTVDQVQPTTGVPAFARKFAGETTQAIQVETWTSPTAGTLSIRTPGRPTDLHGSYTLTEVDGSTLQQFDGEVKVKVPLIGGKLENLMAELFVAGKAKEQAAAAAWLAGDR